MDCWVLRGDVGHLRIAVCLHRGGSAPAVDLDGAALSQPQRDMDDATVYRKTVVGHRNRVQSPHAYASRACGFWTLRC